MATTNYNDYHYFSFIAKNPHYGFATYRDPKTGSTVGYIVGYDKNNQPVYKYWHFNYDSQRIKRVGKDECDLEKKTAYEFLKNAPGCMGSENGEYIGEKQTGYYFKEINTAKDAKDAVDTRRKLIEAQSVALQLKGQELDDISSYIGIFDEKEEIKVHRVLDFASNSPTKFLALINDKTLRIRSLIRRGINKGVLNEQGKMILWEGVEIGADEDDAIAKLMKDDKLKKAIETNLSKVAQ